MKALNQEFQVLISLVCESVAEFRHFDLRRVAVSVTPSRTPGKHGVWAYVVPLRYVGGGLERRGLRYGMPGFYRFLSEDIERHQPEARYIMTFLVPKFFRLTPQERLETIVHELYHLHPTLRGDLRRFDPPHIHHGPTPQRFKARVRELVGEAVSNAEWLFEHPLLKGEGEGLMARPRKHFRIPRRVFRPALWALALTMSLGLAPGASARQVVLQQNQALRERPSADAAFGARLRSGRQLRALKLSSDRGWVYVSDGVQGGWVPRSSVKAVPTPKAGSPSTQPRATAPVVDPFAADADLKVMSSSGDGEFDPFESDMPKNQPLPSLTESRAAGARGGIDLSDADGDDEPPDLDVEDIGKDGLPRGFRVPHDPKKDPFTALRAGKLFEEPSALAVRYGIIEVGDVVRPLERSKDRKWLRIRLELTGEEGWYPASWIQRRRSPRLGRSASKVLGALGGLGSGGYGMGGMGFFTSNLWDAGREGRPADRLEVSGEAGYFLGFTARSGSVEASAKFLEFQLLGRFMPSTATGHLMGGPEAGLALSFPMVSAPSISEEVKKELGVGGGMSIGVVGGATLAYAMSPDVQVRGSIRVRIGGGTAFFGLLGLGVGLD